MKLFLGKMFLNDSHANIFYPCNGLALCSEDMLLTVSIHSRERKRNEKSSAKQQRKGHDFGSQLNREKSTHMKSLSNVCDFFLSLLFQLVNLWTVIWAEMVFRIWELNACVTYVGNLVFVRKACCRHFASNWLLRRDMRVSRTCNML